MPEDLVGEQVPDPGDHGLVGQCGLEAAPAAPEQVVELVAADGGGVRALGLEGAGEFLVVREPEALELALVAVAELANNAGIAGAALLAPDGSGSDLDG